MLRGCRKYESSRKCKENLSEVQNCTAQRCRSRYLQREETQAAPRLIKKGERRKLVPGFITGGKTALINAGSHRRHSRIGRP